VPQVLDLESTGCVDVGQHGPVIYKAMVKIGLARLWEPLSCANEQTLRVTRDQFTKVFLTWLGVDDQFEVLALNSGAPTAACRGCCASFQQRLMRAACAAPRAAEPPLHVLH
jgi:hypothetical protein